MSQVKSHFSCVICKQVLNFPPDTSIVDFVILFLQFFKSHEICEQSQKAAAAEAKMKEAVKAVTKKRGKNGKAS